jgi:pimeloyl-ACP methyl ester carboxylesterase
MRVEPAVRLPFQYLKYIAGSSYSVLGKLIYVYELHYAGHARLKRCFVGHASMDANTKPVLCVALPGSNSAGEGAKDLFSATDIQGQWPLKLAASEGVFFVAIDLPSFGASPYTPDNAIEPLMDVVKGVEAARKFIEHAPGFKTPKLADGLLVGGFSWGATLAEWFVGACPNVERAYIASGQLAKQYDTRPMFHPPSWVDYDYKDMLKVSRAKNIRLQFGGVTDYLYEPFRPHIDGVIAELCADPRFSFVNPPIGHTPDVADMLAYLSAGVGPAQYHMDVSGS